MSAGRREVREEPNEGRVRVGSFGERLRREREMRGVALEDIANATKIGTRLLRALEEEHFELLPGGIFNKGFVRAYAKYLGLNEEEAVADYLEAAGEKAPDPRVIAEQSSSRIDRSGGNARPTGQTGFPVIPVLILLLVIAAGAGGWHIYQERIRDREAKRQAIKPNAVTTQVAAIPEAVNPVAATTLTPLEASATKTEVPGGTAPANPNNGMRTSPTTSPSLDIAKTMPGIASPASPAGSGTSASTQSFEVTVRAKDSAWVSIKSDGRFSVRGIIRPPDVKTVHASDQVVVWTGNAGAVEVSFNGQPVPLAGGPNQEGVLVFNSHGAVSPKPGQ